MPKDGDNILDPYSNLPRSQGKIIPRSKSLSLKNLTP